MDQSIEKLLTLHNRLLLELSHYIGGNEIWDYREVSQKIIDIAREGIDVSRISIWNLNSAIDSMECLALSVDGSFVDVNGVSISAMEYPNYFNALRDERFIVADDAHTHPDTYEFSESYLTPLNIFSMLDAPIRKDGKIVGIVCCEQTQHPRAWSLLEQSFTAMLADSAGRALAEESARESLNALMHSIHTDSLTSLYNRTKLIEDLKDFQNIALAVFDIDDFTNINDFYGYDVGNAVLIQLSKNILLLSLGKGTLYRYNNDKFALLVHNETKKEVLSLVESILDHTNIYAYNINDFTVPVKLSAVLSFEPPESIIQSIDILRKELKKQNHRLMTYNKSLGLETKISNNITWNKKIKDALIEDRIVCYYQPILNNKTLKIEKYESLVRLIDKNGAIISPYHFLEVAKHSKQYIAITKKVIENSFEMFRDEDTQFSINLTMEDILNPEIAELLTYKMFDKKYHSRVVYEIVESEGLEQAEGVYEFIKNGKKFGCEIAIDDFGTGYSNFEYLIKLTPDYIKIDGSMIKEITTNLDTEEVVKTIVDFAKKRNLKTIAEFVHSREVFDKILELGIDYSQGYYIGEPQPTLDKELTQKDFTTVNS